MSASRRKRRLYFILPDVPTARIVVDELLLDRVEERHMHVLAREDTDLAGLPPAGLFQRSDIVHGAELGLVVGGATGIIAGIAALLLRPESWVAEGGLILAMALIGALVGTWLAGMVGTSVPNTRLKAFRKDLEAGRILLMVDIPEERIDEIREMVRKHHPEAGDRGVEPRTPAFP